jgi:hypothetical protein
MVEDGLKKICAKALSTSFPNLEIVDMIILPTYRHDESKDDWIKDSHTFFIQLKKNDLGMDTVIDVTRYLEMLFGFECCVDFS